MNKFSAFLLISLLTIVSPGISPAYAAQSQVLLYPTRIILENNEATATVGLKNSGDGPGNYRIELIDMQMPEQGPSQEVKPEDAQFSARKMIRISPRSVTLPGGQEQTIRLMIRRPRDLAEGEYRSHLKVTMSQDDTAPDQPAPTGNGVGISIRPQLALIIPVIIRHGQTGYTVKINSAKYRTMPDESGKPVPYIDINFTRTGNRSTMGDIEVTYKPYAGGRSVVVKHMAGIPIYRPTERRTLSIPLDLPQGTTIGKGTFHVTYRAQEKEGNKVMAEGDFGI